MLGKKDDWTRQFLWYHWDLLKVPGDYLTVSKSLRSYKHVRRMVYLENRKWYGARTYDCLETSEKSWIVLRSIMSKTPSPNAVPHKVASLEP